MYDKIILQRMAAGNESTEPGPDATGIEVVEHPPNPASGEDLLALFAEEAVASVRRNGKARSLPPTPELVARLEAEQLSLTAQLVRQRRESERRERDYAEQVAWLQARQSELESELAERDAKLAALTKAREASPTPEEGHDTSAGGMAVGSIDRHGSSHDAVASLKARLEERYHALAVAREEIAELKAKRARLSAALAERGEQVAQLLAQVTRAEVRGSFGMDFRSGLRRLFQRDPAAATGGPAVADWNLSSSEDPTLAIEDSDAPAPDCAGPGEPADQGSARPASSSPRAVPTRRQGTRPAPVLRRYLIRLESDTTEIFELAGPRSYIGRGIEADVRIHDPTISRLHGVIYLIGGAAIVEDARSTNGIFVNERRIRQFALKDGDTVAFGRAKFQFRLALPESTAHV